MIALAVRIMRVVSVCSGSPLQTENRLTKNPRWLVVGW
jgi:hypothetical protein